MTRVLHVECQSLVGQLANAFGAKRPTTVAPSLCAKVEQRVHLAELLRTAMVLLVDHELTSSAFAARITASTGASLPALPSWRTRHDLRPLARRRLGPRQGANR
ncbi:citrate/2-methylcitrate synthase [Cupriavidus sp. HPC(L)]|uniref:citrate/2-methylcitrate synthase n=1 Tax=Cupriavidus sp. HPC(L) TaxID=1217418 RepID=UPI0035298C04